MIRAYFDAERGMNRAYVYRCPGTGWRWLCTCHEEKGVRFAATWEMAYYTADTHVAMDRQARAARQGVTA